MTTVKGLHSGLFVSVFFPESLLSIPRSGYGIVASCRKERSLFPVGDMGFHILYGEQINIRLFSLRSRLKWFFSHAALQS